MRPETSGPRTTRKHRQVYSSLSRDIHSGRWKLGERLPSEAQLVARFGVSRITIGRAVRDLQAAGLVERRAGSGTFVKRAHAAGGCSFGLLIPNREETGIFEPIWEGMMASPRARGHALVWGSAAAQRPKEERAWELCLQYIERKVSGVFFAPLELTPFKDEYNRRIVRALDEARIPVVLLDRPLVAYPQAGRHDLIGIDNRRAGHVITEHLLRLGCRRVLFVGPENAASTVDEREAGYREALYAAGVQFDPALTHRMD
ncbi:MAG: GntR family transcriptional regulator, partial [Gammaproteobacteria bacterium]